MFRFRFHFLTNRVGVSANGQEIVQSWQISTFDSSNNAAIFDLNQPQNGIFMPLMLTHVSLLK